MIIRQGNQTDYQEISLVVESAFEKAERTDGNEHHLVDKLRNSSGYIRELELVAIKDQLFIGHIMFTKVQVGMNSGIALAPLSVLPEFQKKGVGKALVNQAHCIAKELGYKFSIVLGSEEYYPKFGYEVAEKYEIRAPFDVPSKNFMVKFIGENILPTNGTVQYVKEMLE